MRRWVFLCLLTSHCGLDVVGAPGATTTDAGAAPAPIDAGPPPPTTTSVLRFLPNGEASLAEPKGTVDCNAPGVVDWSMWGSNADTAQRRKNLPTPLISDVQRDGITISSSGSSYDWPVRARWNDGKPPAVAGDTQDFVYTTGRFVFDVSVSARVRTLTLHVGAFNARVDLTATLSDGTAPPITTSIENSRSEVAGRWLAIEMASGAADARVRIALVNTSGVFGAVNMLGVTLSE